MLKFFQMENLLPQWIEQQLRERGWSQADLIKIARKKGHTISDATLSRILNETRRAGNDALRALADVFDVSSEFMFRLAGELPYKSEEEDDLTLRELYELAKSLNRHERRRLANVARLYLQEQREQYDSESRDDTEPGTAAAPAT